MTQTTSLAAPVPRARRHLSNLFPVFLRPTALYRFFKDGRASRGSKILLVLAIGYALWPIDLIPDVAPLIGWLDDLGVATAALSWVAIQVTRHEHKREMLESVL